jgi:hypothetical protein
VLILRAVMSRLVKYDADHFIPFANHSGDDVRGLELMRRRKERALSSGGFFVSNNWLLPVSWRPV